MARTKIVTFRAPEQDYQRIQDAAHQMYGESGMSRWLLEAAMMRLNSEPAAASEQGTTDTATIRAQLDYIANHLGITLPAGECIQANTTEYSPRIQANTDEYRTRIQANTGAYTPPEPQRIPANTPRRRLDTDPAAMAILMERYAQGIAPAAVADELNAAGYTTGGGKPWDKASVSETGYRARRAAAKAKDKSKT